MRRIALVTLALAAAACNRDTTAPDTTPTAQNDALAAWRGPRSGEVVYCLTVLHNNDGESKLTQPAVGVTNFGGVARFATLVRQLKTEALGADAAGAANADGETAVEEAMAPMRGGASCDDADAKVRRGVVMVSSGDNFLAGAEFQASLDKGVPYYDGLALDEVGYDALAIGNHEFDFGPDVLADFIESFGARGSFRTPFLSSNLDVSGEPRLAAFVQDRRIAKSVIITARGARIGIVGATTPRLATISSPRNVQVLQDVAGAIQQEVDGLRRRGVEKIILISHLQSVAEDLALVPQLRGIDVAVSGGGSDLLANDGDLLIPGERPVGPYPLTARDAENRAVPVVTTDGNYKYVGRLVVGFDKDGEIVQVGSRSGPVRVSGIAPDAVMEDATVKQLVTTPVQAYVADLATRIVAQSAVPLDGVRNNVRTVETNLGSLITDAMLQQARALAPQFGVAVPQVALQNGGGIRNDNVIPAGPLSELNTFAILPFLNFVSVVPGVPRDEFKQILENAYSRVEFRDGRFAQVAGMRVTYSASGTPQVIDVVSGQITQAGTRVRDVVLDDGTVIIQNGAVVPGPALSVATIDFLARPTSASNTTGGDQYPFNARPFTTLGITYQQALANYLRSLPGGVTAQQYPVGGSGRITRVP
jgi:5'-nucleotidase